MAKKLKTEYIHIVDALKLERALAILDPMGLISMGAPLDEYCAEAEAVMRAVGYGFSAEELIDTVTVIMNASFNGAFNKVHPEEVDVLLDLFFEDIDPIMRFSWGETYKVLQKNIMTRFDVGGLELHSGDMVTCIYRMDRRDNVRLCLMINGEFKYFDLSIVDESRMRWFFDEVG